ncbi:hypothetical protein EJB05_51968, partial [Eragrostis curvula]
MEELAAVPPRRHRERRHRRKASDAAAAALASSFGDVFGGPPRFDGSAPSDYSDVFGGVAASCSIPYLDLPEPAAAAAPGGGGGEYGEIFGRFDFGEFAAPYEDALAGPEEMMEEIGSTSGSSRSSIRTERGPLYAEPSALNIHYPDSGCDKHFGEEQFYPVSSPPNGEQKFSMSYNKATRGRPDDLVEMTTCIVEPSISYVVDSCNFSNDSEMDHIPVIDNVDTLANDIKGKVSPPNATISSMKNADSASVVDQLQHIPTNVGTLANGIEGKTSPPNVTSCSMKNADSASAVDELQHIPTCLPTTTATTPISLPVSENIYEDENYDKRSSTHSVSSEEAPSPDYPFLRVSSISLPAAPIKVQPPPMPPSKLLNKRESKENGDSAVNPNSAAAAAAMKEAMEFAEARLKAAKELMERKGDSFKLRKRPGHHRSTKSTEIKGSKIPEEVRLFERKPSMNILAKEENQNKDLSLPDNNRDGSAVKSIHCDPDKHVVVSVGKPQEPQNTSKLEESGKWTSDAEFYELISHDQRCKPNAALSEGNNGAKSSCTKVDQTEKEKAGGFAGELRKARKLWDTTGLRRETVNLVKDGTSSVEVEHKAPTPPEVLVCEERATYQERSDSDFKPCPEMDLEVHDDGGRVEISCVNNTPAKVHANLEMPEQERAGGFSGEPKRVRKLWDTSGLKRETVNLVKDGTSSVGVEHEPPRPSEVPFCEERATYQEPSNSHFEQCPGVEKSIEGHDDNDGIIEISCSDSTRVKVQPYPEISSSILEDYISGGWHDSKNHCGASSEETLPVGQSKQDDNTDEIMCTSVMSQSLREDPDIPNIDEIKDAQVKISNAEESGESHETCEKEKLLDFVYEAYVQNESERENEVIPGTHIHEERKKFGISENEDTDEDFQDVDVYQDAGSPEKETTVTLESANGSQNDNAESKVLTTSVENGKFMEANARTCGSLDKDPYLLQELQGSLGPQDLENRIDIVEDIVSDGVEKEAKESVLESADMTLVEEVLNHDSNEGKISMETSIRESPEVYAEVNAKYDRDDNTFHSVREVRDDDSDYAPKMNTWSNSLQASFSEACNRMQHLFQNAGYSSAEKAHKSTPIKDLLEEDCKEADREIPTEKCTPLEEGQTTGEKMEERDREDSISNIGLKDQQLFHLDSDTRSNFAEDAASDIAHKSRDGELDAQRTKEKDNVKDTEGETEVEVHVRLDEEKEKEWKIEKEKEDKERRRRELEEEKEREMERAKDRLAVQRATREAHERAFAEARAKAEKIALEKITSARQRASAEARAKEERATAEAASDKASREARLKAERAAVERATAEARERAIEKAKAAADAKDRMERFRSSFKDSSKTTNQETQFQRMISNNRERNTNSCNEVEIESALRHKAKSEREQRTAERAAKALAEKNMRDMLAQREQAERHRLAEFLDPEVKRWSNGKEGNLRALLSTLQYILGADSGWQSVPLTDLITAAGVKKAYRRATLCVHPDKVQQRGATIRQKYICEKVFDLLKEAWNKFNSEER